MKKTITLVGVGIAALATIFGIVTLCTVWSEAASKVASTCFGFAFLLSLVSYILCGGMGKAIKSAWGVAKTMWFLFPVFPVDLCMGIVGFFMGMCMFFCLPIFFVLKSVREKNALHRETKIEAAPYTAQSNVYSGVQYNAQVNNQYRAPQYNTQYAQQTTAQYSAPQYSNQYASQQYNQYTAPQSQYNYQQYTAQHSNR